MNNESAVVEDKAKALFYIKTFSDTAREPFLILDLDLKIIGANTSFFQNFQVSKEETENKFVYDLGNGQWNIPELRDLLERILPEKEVINDFEVTHTFPNIGTRVMLLNARRFDSTQMILLAIEDITLKRKVEINLANYTKELEKGIAIKTEELKIRIDELTKINEYMVDRELKMIDLKKEITDLKKSKTA